jgi:chromosome segregation ATPase
MVEFDEIEKRLAWLDSERQKDKKLIKELQDTIEGFPGLIQKQSAEIKSLETAVKVNSPLPARIDQLGEEISSNRAEIMKKIIDVEKSIATGDKKVENVHKDEVDNLNKRLIEFHSELKTINELKKTVYARVEEEFRIGQKVENVENQIPELHTTDEDIQRQVTLILGERNQDSKRITDLQLETAALKKRVEEVRNNYDLDKEAIRKIDKKIDDIVVSEKERKQNQVSFLEKVSLEQVTKNSQWKEWQEKFADLQKIGPSLNAKMLDFDEALRSIKKTQSDFDDINERFNRRINEITEMNRLAEVRFRQEWIAFKADDQKRWTNYTLAREEESREDARTLNQVNDRLIKIEDAIQDMQDTIGLLTEETKKQVNGLYSATQEMVESFNQTFKKRL